MKTSQNIFFFLLLVLCAACAVGTVFLFIRQNKMYSRVSDVEDRMDSLIISLDEQRFEQRKLQKKIEPLNRSLDQLHREIDSVSSTLENLDTTLDPRFEKLKNDMHNEIHKTTEHLSTRQDRLEAFWANKGELLHSIPDDVLNSGYALSWKHNKLLPLDPVDEGVLISDDNEHVTLTGGGYLRSSSPATPLSKPLTESGDFTVLVTLKPADLIQEGPARIVSISRDPGYRNFTIGQEKDNIVVRVRTTATGDNGTNPQLVSTERGLTGEKQQIIFTRHDIDHHLYIDGEPAASLEVDGDLSNWDHSLPLLIGNEATGDRAWEGDIYNVVFFNHALSEKELNSLNENGPNGMEKVMRFLDRQLKMDPDSR